MNFVFESQTCENARKIKHPESQRETRECYVTSRSHNGKSLLIQEVQKILSKETKLSNTNKDAKSEKPAVEKPANAKPSKDCGKKNDLFPDSSQIEDSRISSIL